MTIASLVLGFVLSSLVGFFFHLWRDGGIGRLVLYVLLSWVGFWGAQALGMYWKLDFLNVGALLVGTNLVGSVVFLFVGHWLSLVKTGEG
jgi:hypothetical protein